MKKKIKKNNQRDLLIMPDVINPLPYSVSCDIGLQNIKEIAVLPFFAIPRISLNLNN